ncbi:hypothetical protein CPB85DRAFT_1440630 [Mucidula mucida]|nr:hypothetical protein CPB85DRAFT_1440630 [Mucidula mucida]
MDFSDFRDGMDPVSEFDTGHDGDVEIDDDDDDLYETIEQHNNEYNHCAKFSDFRDGMDPVSEFDTGHDGDVEIDDDDDDLYETIEQVVLVRRRKPASSPQDTTDMDATDMDIT